MVNVPPANTETRLRHFTIAYFQALGAAVSDAGSLLRVELSPDQLAELEGRANPRPSWFGWQEDQGSTVLYLCFTPEHPDSRAELVCPGSHRFEQMLASARRQGSVSLLTLVPHGAAEPGPQIHRPYLLLHFRLTYRGRSQREELVPICVDLVDGSLHPEIARAAETWSLVDRVPARVEQRRLGFKAAWDIACHAVTDALREQDDGWAREALLALAQERRFLMQYYAAQGDHSEQLAAERRERLAEAERRSQPRVIGRTNLAAVLFVPTTEA